MSIALAAVLALAPQPESDHWFVDSANRRMQRPDRIDPDEPRFELAYPGMRARATFGGQLGLWGVQRPDFDFALVLSPFVELVNIQRAGIPWHTYRANVGITTMWRPHLRRQGADLRIEFAYHHESDHAAWLQGLQARFAPGAGPDNGNFSAFEYFRLSADWTQDWTRYGAPRLETMTIASVRPYTPSINPGDARQPTVGLAGEARVLGRVAAHTRLWLGAYGEWVHNRFVPEQHFVRDAGGAPLDRATPFVHRIVQAGATFDSRWADLSLFVQYSNSTSRTVDFFVRRGHEPGFGVRMRL